MTDKQTFSTDYDVVIVGAGIAGSFLSHAILQKSPTLNILLIDNNPEQLEKSRHPGFDARSIALSAGSCELLDDLGLWSVLQEKAQAIDDIHISDRGHRGVLDLIKKEEDTPFGYVVELQNVGEIINHQLAKYPQLTRLYNTCLVSLEKQTEQVLCQLQDGTRFSAKLCVAADGADSLTRQLLEIQSESFDYGCSAIIANVALSQPHLNKAYERFTKDGPIALLPLTENRFSLVWSVNNHETTRLMALDDVACAREIQQAFGYRAGIVRTVGKRDTYPLHLIKINKPITHRGICIGNAAHCLHPVMGQGFNLGLRDLYSLAQVINQLDDLKSLGDYQMINQYWSMRRQDHHKTIWMTDAIVRGFSSENGLVVLGRNITLRAMSCFPVLSSPIVMQAKGQFNLQGINNDSIL